MNHLSKAGGSQDGMEHQKTDIHNGITSSHGSKSKCVSVNAHCVKATCLGDCVILNGQCDE